jgi:aspartate kinase
MSSLVMKFGGSSVANAQAMRQVAALVKNALPKAPVVVLSAMDKTTDGLFSAARSAARGEIDPALQMLERLARHHRAEAAALVAGDAATDLDQALQRSFAEIELHLRSVALLRSLSPETMDAIAAFGEQLSTRIFAAHLVAEGVPAELVDARLVLRTDGRSGSAQPIMEAVRSLCARHLEPILQASRVVVTQGYVGATESGLTTTLGRGGSDYSAALFAAALRSSECQIWTDVEGVLTADPRVVEQAMPIPELSFSEAAELAAFGAKVLHPATIQPAIETNVPVTVRHTRRPDGRFTTITANVRTGRPVTALATRGPITVLTVTSTRMLAQSGFLQRLFEVFGRLRVSIDLVATAEVSVSMTVDADAPLPALLRELSAFATVEAAESRAIVAIVGERLKSTPGLAARVFSALGDINVEMISMGANEINLSVVVQHHQRTEALRRLHVALIEAPAAAWTGAAAPARGVATP